MRLILRKPLQGPRRRFCDALDDPRRPAGICARQCKGPCLGFRTDETCSHLPAEKPSRALSGGSVVLCRCEDMVPANWPITIDLIRFEPTTFLSRREQP